MTRFHYMARGDIHIMLDPERPHWFAGNAKARDLFEKWHQGQDESALVRHYSKAYASDPAKSFIFVHDFLQKLERIDLLRRDSPPAYDGRHSHLSLDKLAEMWLHTNNSCNLACRHCLVESSPKADSGPDTATLMSWIQAGVDMGVERFYFTGGEPFYRKDMLELIRTVTETHGKELIIITNGLLLDTIFAQGRSSLAWDQIKLQISLDGTSKQTNDAIRGNGCFSGVMTALEQLAKLPVEAVLTAVVHPHNADELSRLPQLANEMGISGIHLMWPHLRGRYKKRGAFHEGSFQDLVLQVLANARQAGVRFDNYESIKWRINGRPDVKFDLSGAGWRTLCIYCDGMVYPSAAFAGHEPLACGALAAEGNKTTRQLETIWRHSAPLKEIRRLSLLMNPRWAADPFRYMLGGGDIEHAYFYSDNGQAGQLTAEDPYYSLYQRLAEEALFDIAGSQAALAATKSGFDGPQLYHAMGEGAIACDSKGAAESHQQEVVTLHSNCVLAFDVDKPRLLVQNFYGQAAETPQEGLCCPVRFDPADIAHIPQDVIDRFYGCGSPVGAAALQTGESYLDLGSGAGIDCFIAARHVGQSGRVIGVDMTDRMLAVAAENKPIVADNLGYDVVKFREGYLEKIPVADRSIDIVTSNCVINLSPDKKAVFAEIWRCLKDGGRTVIADIICDRAVPPHMKINPLLWGECLSGSLTQEEFLSYLEDAGFFGVELLKKTYWKQVEDCKFYSVTVRAFKYEKRAECHFAGQQVIYRGPFKGVTDEEGHYYARNHAVAVCTDTYAKLSVGPLKESFIFLTKTGDENLSESCCEPET